MNCLDAENFMKNNATIFNMTANKSKCVAVRCAEQVPTPRFSTILGKTICQILGENDEKST